MAAAAPAPASEAPTKPVADKVAKSDKSAKAVKTSAPDVRILSLSQIEADYAWNCRHVMRTTTEGSRPETDGDPDLPGLEGIAGSLESEGQWTAVEVRPNPVKGAAAEFALVAGFRRYSGVRYLESHDRSVLGLERGQIRALVHPATMTESEARKANVGENVGRENLVTPDVVFAVKKLLEVEPNLSAKELATRYAKSGSHMSAIVKVAKHLRDGTFTQWRDSPLKPLPLIELVEVASKPRSEQETAYAEAIALYQDGRTSTPDAKAWLKSAMKRSEAIGTLIGVAHRRGLLVLDTDKPFDDEDSELIRVFVKFKKKISGKKVPRTSVAKISAAFIEAFVAARDKEDEEEDDDDAAENLD